jgi:hypothetical protein
MHRCIRLLRAGAIAMVTLGCSAAIAAHSAPPGYVNMPMFYIWYWKDDVRHVTGWDGGVLETPMVGYYDSKDYATAYRELKALAEWGCNTACLSWWGKQQDEIVDTYARAARALQAEGYAIWLTCYVEKDFSYEDLASNAQPGAMLEHAVRRYVAQYPDVFAKLDGEPFLVVYGRCGEPVHPTDKEGFRAWLQQRYGSVSSLNQAWGTNYADFAAIEHDPFFPGGWLRAESLRFSVIEMGRQYAAMNDALRAAGLPGVRLCADIGAFDSRLSGFTNITRIFGGVHTYNDMAEPEQRDLPCYAYSQAAKHFGGLSFSHVKAKYNDSVHRIPGFIYSAEPVKFDRWFTMALLQRSTKVQHPSWNEFWEGSNIEPSLEFRKQWVEKNEFYSSILDECWPEMIERDTKAPLAVIFNEWVPFFMNRPAAEVWGVISMLRRLDVEFVLLPEWLATDERLADFRVVVAPSCGQGFGFNERGEPVGEALVRWAKTGQGRKLLLTRAPDLAQRLGLKIVQQAGERAPLHWLLDVGTDQDQGFLGRGWRGGEDWGPPAPGETGYGKRRTIRWTNAQRSVARLRTVAGHDYLLRIAALWHYPCKGKVLVNEKPVGEFAGESGVKQLEFHIPKEVIGTGGESYLRLEHDDLWVPAKVGRGDDTSTLGIAVDVIEVAAVDHQNDQLEQAQPTDEIVVTSAALGEEPGARFRIPATPWKDVIEAPQASVLARYADGSPKFLLAAVGENEVLYDNGTGGLAMDERMTRAILGRWAQQPVWNANLPEGILATRLRSGDTTLLVVSNATGSEEKIEIPLQSLSRSDGKPLASVARLTRDGVAGRHVFPTREASTLSERLKWCAVYEVVHSPVGVGLPRVNIAAGQERTVELTLRNLTSVNQAGTITIAGSPSLRAESVSFALKGNEEKKVRLRLRASDALDWGVRTIRARVKYDGGQAAFWDFMDVAPPAGWQPVCTAREIPASALQGLRSGGGQLGATAQNLGTGKGTVTVESEKLRVVFDELMGGAVRSFVVKRDDGAEVDYGAGSFVSEYRLGDRVVSQMNTAGRLSLARHGDSEAEVGARWSDAEMEFRQTWRIYAGAPYLRVSVSAWPRNDKGETVVALLNTRLRRNDIRRIYPGFTTLGENTGWKPETKALHFGWKEYWGSWVPDAWVALEPSANNVQQGIALICATPKSVAGFRQGFYPRRPAGLPPAVDSTAAAPNSPARQAIPEYEPGTADFCEIEVYSLVANKPAQAEFIIYSFGGYWDKFKEFLRQFPGMQ